MPKFVGEDSDTYTVLNDEVPPKEIRVAKAGLSPERKSAIEGMKPQPSTFEKLGNALANSPNIVGGSGLPTKDNISGAQTTSGIVQEMTKEQAKVEPPKVESAPAAAPAEASKPSTTYTPVPGAAATKTQTQMLSPEGKQMIESSRQSVEESAKAIEAQVAAKQSQNEDLLLQTEINNINNESKRAWVEDNERKRIERESEVIAQKTAADKAAGDFKFQDYFENNSRIGASIAIALGTLGQAFSGGPNTALTIVQDSIKRDMDLQKAKYAQTRDKSDAIKGSYDMLVKSLGSERAADAAYMSNGIEKAKERINELVLKTNDPVMKANGEAEIAKLNQVQAEKEMELAKTLQTTVITETAGSPGFLKGSDGSTKPLPPAAFKSFDELKKSLDSDDDLKEFKKKRGAVAQFNSLVKNGAPATAMAKFIAGNPGLQQGSFGPDFANLLKEEGLVGRTAEEIRKFFEGGANPKYLTKLQNALNDDMRANEESLRPTIEMYQQEVGRFGQNPAIVTGALSQGEKEEKEVGAAGAKPRYK